MFHEKNVAGVRSVLPYWAVLAYSAVGLKISAVSAGHRHAGPIFLLVRASFSVRTLRFSPVSALAAATAAAVALALAREFSVK